MKRILHIILLAMLLAAAMVIPASAQDETGLYYDDETGLYNHDARLLACIAGQNAYRDLFDAYELWKYVDALPPELMEILLYPRELPIPFSFLDVLANPYSYLM